jgi:hypothetical protein
VVVRLPLEGLVPGFVTGLGVALAATGAGAGTILNVAEPPVWSIAHQASPLFAPTEDGGGFQERSNFLDGLVERWKSKNAIVLSDVPQGLAR